MKIKQLKEKTIKGFIDFLPKLSIEAIPGLQDKFNDIENKTITDVEITQAGGQEGGTLEGVDIYLIYAGSRAGKLTGISNATTTIDGCMSHEDKKTLDAVKNTYLPLSGGKMTGTLDIDFTEGIQIIEHDLNPRNTYIGNGSIIIESLDGDTSNVISKTEIKRFPFT